MLFFNAPGGFLKRSWAYWYFFLILSTHTRFSGKAYSRCGRAFAVFRLGYSFFRARRTATSHVRFPAADVRTTLIQRPSATEWRFTNTVTPFNRLFSGPCIFLSSAYHLWFGEAFPISESFVIKRAWDMTRAIPNGGRTSLEKRLRVGAPFVISIFDNIKAASPANGRRLNFVLL